MAGTIKCSNCSREIPATAKACKFCEATVQEEPSEDEKKLAKEMLDQMDPDARAMLIDAIKNADTADELIRSIFVGSCPRCGSDNTGDGENDPEIDNPLVGRCMDCHFYWCTECGRVLDAKNPDCPCWKEEIPGLEDL